MKRIIAMYLRVSTLDQARNGYGLGDQEVQCKKYIDLYYYRGILWMMKY